MEMGEFAAPRNNYKAAFGTAERLAKADAGNARWQRDLTVSYERLGAVLEAAGDYAAALQNYRAGLAIRRRLATSDPSNARWQRDMALLYGRISKVELANGNNTAAIASDELGAAINRRLAKTAPQFKEGLPRKAGRRASRPQLRIMKSRNKNTCGPKPLIGPRI